MKSQKGDVKLKENWAWVIVKLRSRSRSGEGQVRVMKVRVRQSPAQIIQNSMIWGLGDL